MAGESMNSIPGPEEGRALALRITRAFVTGSLDLSSRPRAPAPGWDGLPEVAVASQLRAAQASDHEVRLFITFTAAMDRARPSDRLWYASGQLFLENRWPFVPGEAARRSQGELRTLLRTYGVSQRHTVDARGWHTIAHSLADPALSGPIARAVYEGRGDARDLLRALQKRGAAGEPRFPLLRGPKVAIMWIRMLAYPGKAELSSLAQLPVAVDVQVRKVTEYLGVADTKGQPIERVRTLIQRAWEADVRRFGAVGPEPLANTPSAVDPALWFFGRWGCTTCERIGRKSPICEVCQECRFDDLRSQGRLWRCPLRRPLS